LVQPLNFTAIPDDNELKAFRTSIDMVSGYLILVQDIADIVKPFDSAAGMLASADAPTHPMSIPVGEARLAVARVLIEVYDIIRVFDDFDRLVWKQLLDLSIAETPSIVEHLMPSSSVNQPTININW
jgi:hypothetical protein